MGCPPLQVASPIAALTRTDSDQPTRRPASKAVGTELHSGAPTTFAREIDVSELGLFCRITLFGNPVSRWAEGADRVTRVEC